MRPPRAGVRGGGPPPRVDPTASGPGGRFDAGLRPIVARGGVRLAAATAAALALAACWVEPAEQAELERAESGPALDERVRTALEGSAAAWNRGDLDGFMAVYRQSPRTTYVGGSGLRVGYDAIRRRYAPLFSPGAERDSLRFEDLSVRAITEEVAVGTARWVLHRGGEVTGSGPFTLVLRHVDGAWKIVHDHSSSDPDGDDAEPEG